MQCMGLAIPHHQTCPVTSSNAIHCTFLTRTRYIPTLRAPDRDPPLHDRFMLCTIPWPNRLTYGSRMTRRVVPSLPSSLLQLRQCCPSSSVLRLAFVPAVCYLLRNLHPDAHAASSTGTNDGSEMYPTTDAGGRGNNVTGARNMRKDNHSWRDMYNVASISCIL
jgi:hypothetical protein